MIDFKISALPFQAQKFHGETIFAAKGRIFFWMVKNESYFCGSMKIFVHIHHHVLALW
jgi:hypothetical protein